MPKQHQLLRYNPRQCAYCHRSYTPTRRWQIYCCDAHRMRAFYIRQAKLLLNTQPTDEPEPKAEVQKWWERPSQGPVPVQTTEELEAEALQALERAKAQDQPVSLDELLGDWSKPFSVDDL